MVIHNTITDICKVFVDSNVGIYFVKISLYFEIEYLMTWMFERYVLRYITGQDVWLCKYIVKWLNLETTQFSCLLKTNRKLRNSIIKRKYASFYVTFKTDLVHSQTKLKNIRFGMMAIE